MSTGQILLDTYAAQPVQWCWREEWHIPGESAWTLLSKFARLNQLTASEFADLTVSRTCGRRSAILKKLVIDLRGADAFDPDVLSRMLRVSNEKLRRAFLYDLVPGTVLRSAAHLRWCRKCMHGAFHSPLYQLHCLNSCPIHNIRLQDACGQCFHTIPYELNRSMFSAPFQCPWCGVTLAAAMSDDRPDMLRLSRDELRRLAYLVRFHQTAEAELVTASDADKLLSGLVGAEISHVAAYRADGGNHFAGFITQVLQSVAPCRVVWQKGFSREPVERHVCGGSAAIPYQDDERLDDELDESEETLALRHAASNTCFETLVTTYKAVRRRLWRDCLCQHQHCIVTAARHLEWDLRGERTVGFCPGALAFLRWRMLWEGCGSPASLVAPQAKELYGILGWHLARPAPTPRHWLARTKTWVTARIFANTVWEAFNRMLAEAEALAKRDEVLWDEACGPVAQDCLWAVAGRDCLDGPATVFVRSAKPRGVAILDRQAQKLHVALHEKQLARITRG